MRASAGKRYTAVWVGVGAPLHHEADTAGEILAWGQQIWAFNMGVVWITPPGAPSLSLTDFASQQSIAGAAD